MRPGRVDLVTYEGDTWSQLFALSYGSEPANLEGATATAAAITLTRRRLELVATVTDPARGLVTLAPGEAGLPADAYRYDLQIDLAGNVDTWVTGLLIVGADIAV